jgi:hypothetical protein
MNKSEAIKTAKPYFKNHLVDTFFVTDDGQCFFDKGSAANHANSLGKDRYDIQEVTREDAEAKSKGKEKTDDGTPQA